MGRTAVAPPPPEVSETATHLGLPSNPIAKQDEGDRISTYPTPSPSCDPGPTMRLLPLLLAATMTTAPVLVHGQTYYDAR